jgi:hypothetical protein
MLEENGLGFPAVSAGGSLDSCGRATAVVVVVARTVLVVVDDVDDVVEDVVGGGSAVEGRGAGAVFALPEPHPTTSATNASVANRRRFTPSSTPPPSHARSADR